MIVSRNEKGKLKIDEEKKKEKGKICKEEKWTGKETSVASI